MSDEFVEVTRQGWGGRIMESIKGILAGVVLFLVSFPLLFLNEGCAVKDMKALDQGKDDCISVSADKSEAANDGKLIHFSAEANTTETLQDEDFKVSANAIKLTRVVEMYQWIEKTESKQKKKLGGDTETGTTYKYIKGWHAGRIDSSEFEKSAEYPNPDLPYDGKSIAAKIVTAGAFQLNPSLVQAIEGGVGLPIKDDILRSLPDNLKSKKTQVQGNTIYVGHNPSSPAVGDLKIAFKITKPAMVSIYAKQNGTQLEAYPTEAGKAIQRLDMGAKSKEAMFAAAVAESEMRTWLTRLAGFVMMLVGIFLVLRPISVLGDVIPFIGNIAGFLLFVAATAAAAGLSLITISVAWVFYRPLIGIPLLVLGIGGLIFGIYIMTRKKAKPVAQTSGEAF